MNHALATVGLPLPPDPLQDRRGKPLPPASAELLIWLQVLLVYARQLRITLRRQAQRGLSLVAQCFGSAQAAFVLTHLTRGILRAIALERVLLADAAVQPHPAAGQLRPGMPPAARHATGPQPSGRRPTRPAADQFPGLPTLRQLETAIRRRPVEHAIDDISHDFGVSLSLCETRFGNALCDMVAAFRGTVAGCLNELLRREAVAAGAPEPKFAFDCPPQQPDAIRYIVGFFGAKPSCGFPFTIPPVAAAAAGARPP